VASITEILFELNSFADAVAKKLYLEEHLGDIYVEITKLDELDREHYIEKILNAFDGTKMKGQIRKTIDLFLASLSREETNKSIGEFSSVDIDSLVTKNGAILATPSNIYEILLAARNIKLLWDKMSANVYLEQMSWEPKSIPYTIEHYGQEIKHYHKYEGDNATMFRIALNKGPFPSEIDFRGLDKVVEAVSQNKTIDTYSDWMDSYKAAYDGNDYINDHSNNFAVKYMGAAPGPWSAAWCRTIMLNLVARCKKPGCLTRFYFVIEGQQNIGKSSWCRLLVPQQWFISTGLTQAQTNEDNFNRSIHDKGVVELAEMGGFHKAENNLVKKIVTDLKAYFRKMRANEVIGYDKHCIMIVTTNDGKYLRDPTGETRAMPLRSELRSGQFIDLDGFANDYPFILAQALHMYEQDERLRFLTQEEQNLQREQTDSRDIFQEDDVYKIVGDYLYSSNGNVLTMDIARKEGLYYKKIYDYVKVEYETMNPLTIIKYPQKVGLAFEKFGFTRVVKGGKIKTEEGWKTAQKWFWNGKE
jgi:hypothetical protein